MRLAPVILGGCVLLAGCGNAVAVAPAPGSTSDRCAGLASTWPSEVAGLTRAETDPASPATAAWGSGDEAIIARCGVPVPGPTSDECIAVDDVDWVVHPLDDGMRMTSYGRDPAIEVLVPNAHAPETLLLPAFGAVAKQGDPTGHRCS